jgi:hypothetical protein
MAQSFCQHWLIDFLKACSADHVHSTQILNENWHKLQFIDANLFYVYWNNSENFLLFSILIVAGVVTLHVRALDFLSSIAYLVKLRLSKAATTPICNGLVYNLVETGEFALALVIIEFLKHSQVEITHERARAYFGIKQVVKRFVARDQTELSMFYRLRIISNCLLKLVLEKGKPLIQILSHFCI